MNRELVVPVGLIIGVVHVEAVVVDALIVPFAMLVKNVHLLGVSVRVNHIQVQVGVLLAPEAPRGGPVVVLRDRNHIGDGNLNCMQAAHVEDVHLDDFGVGVELHLSHQALMCEVGLHQERKQ